ncbi:MAG: M23 family metallopeptidase [Candidatus Eremiobacteraeota bacterium]|nr:M23 family metallopeptidase [Candidatus Eremiobacteraeota bacterium]
MDISADLAAIQLRIAQITGAGAAPEPPVVALPGGMPFGAYLSAALTPPQDAVLPQNAAMRMPVQGQITSEFGERQDPMGPGREFHPGIDIAADQGTPIQAAMAGQVVSVGSDGGYGNLITVDDGNGLQTRYAHCSQMFARVGQTVFPGDVIGAVGMTGRATGPHLHFEVRQNGEPVDPLRYL